MVHLRRSRALTSETTPMLACAHARVCTHTHTHTSLEAGDLCPPGDPKVQLMLDLMGVGASAPRFHDPRGGW